MAIRLVAMDLDDTLLRDDWTISPRVVKAILKAREQGVKVTFATGRMPISTRPYAEKLGLDLPVITYHGAMIQQAVSGDILYRQVISSPLSTELVRDLAEKGIYSQIYLKDRVIAQTLNEWSQEYARIARVNIEEADLANILSQEPEGVEKILGIAGEADLDQLRPLLHQRYGNKVHITKSKPHFLEIVERSVNKGVALAYLAKGFGILQQEVMAIGDSLNDLEMIQYAGVGVAMGNARPEIKDQADFVTASNEEDGVAEAIERFVLKPGAGQDFE
ncbi:HAD-superfamily hydrolase, subfamily IIB [Desulfosporosinus orientis DSM 765]|uniref:HAD-superfamily hydrolase, subfamily IIB n=1 Tax=Desulfosporosinus orientis (strain ATCC 19365 / DSM 765 / NCIMB 8382 / VKM B-1628 / Singapore I) TaxID=768706 RepID=G7WGC3_DESOD|nr:Cof-type HAD-IIB family hydrolase [Desulfosporosinus orientis]AET70855.1 HAD-superfamily hydrolase, subfamily IIB [Desulfosporosinus orientis DSM 765]